MSIVSTVRDVVTVFQKEKVTFLAASVAFYAFLSIVPLLVLTLAVGSLFGEEALADRILSLVGEQLSEEGQALVSEAVTDTSGRGAASLVSIVALTWSALKVFRSIDLAFDQVYKSQPETSLPQQIINGLTVLGTVALAVVVMVVLGTVLRRPGFVEIPFVDIFGWAMLLIGLVVVFLPLYYVMPPDEMTVRAALPGTLVVSGGWLVLQAGFQVYTAHAGQYQAYGLLGAVLLFVLWLYFASILVLFGAVVNAVLESEIQSNSSNHFTISE